MHIQPQKRRRGVLLTPQGLRKLQSAKQQAEDHENDAKHFTLDRLTTRTGLDSHTLCKIFNCTARVDRRSLVRCFLAFSLLLEPGDYELPAAPSATRREAQELESREKPWARRAAAPVGFSLLVSSANPNTTISACSDDGSMPDVSRFYGRTAELAMLHEWMQAKDAGRTASPRCRLIALSGQVGMGKTWLAAKLVEQMQDDFEYVFWRSLHTAPAIPELLTQLIQFVSGYRAIPVSTSLNDLIDQAMDHLRSSRCLLVLDNLETILRGCDQAGCNLFAGHYCPDYEGYRIFLRRVTATHHQSCVVLTSREFPQDIAQQVNHGLPIHSLSVKGLPVAPIQKILQHQGAFQGTLVDWIRLTNCYIGNPLILQRVGRSIQCLFGGNIAAFLSQDIVLFGEICDLLNQQLERLSDSEKDLMTALARQSKSVSFPEMRSQIGAAISSQALLAGLNSLNMRSLLEISDGSFSLLPLVARHVRERYPV